jgi:hypothetical protein
MTQATATRTTAPLGRSVFAVLLAGLVVVLIGSFGILLLAMARSGDYLAFFHPGLERLGDPKDSMIPIGPDSVGNPLVWVFGLSRVAAFFVLPIAAVATVLGVFALIPAWRGRDRRAVRRLGIVTGAWVALGVVFLTPYGMAMLTWLLD